MADVLKSHTATTIAAVKAQLQEQHEEQAEADARAQCCNNLILRGFPMASNETPTTLAAELSQLATRLELEGEVDMAMVGSRRLPRARGKTDDPPPILLTFLSSDDRARVLAGRTKLEGTPWGLDEDITPMQQAQRPPQ
eukprot:jgi/Mesvir1/377/Mv11272-RA.1